LAILELFARNKIVWPFLNVEENSTFKACFGEIYHMKKNSWFTFFGVKLGHFAIN